MSRTFVRTQEQIGATHAYDDTQAAGSTLGSNSESVEDDLNAIRSQIKRAFYAAESGNWYDDLPLVNGQRRSLNTLNTDLNGVETKKFIKEGISLIDLTVDQGAKAVGTLTFTDQPEQGHESEGVLEFENNTVDDIASTGALTASSNLVGEVNAAGVLTASANIAGGAAASHTLTLNENLSDAKAATLVLGGSAVSTAMNGYTITIDTITYTLSNWASMDAQYDIYDGEGAFTWRSLHNSITNDADTTYHIASPEHPTVTATVDGSNKWLVLEVKTPGAAGNDTPYSYTGEYCLWVAKPLGKPASPSFSGGKDADTITIDGKTYTFQDTLTNVDGNVHIGANASATLDNLIDAINLGSGAGTDYAAAMTLHSTVTASAGTGDTMDITAKTAGPGGNSIEVSTSAADALWTSWNFTGGDVGIAASKDVTFGSIPVIGVPSHGAFMSSDAAWNHGDIFTIKGRTYRAYNGAGVQDGDFNKGVDGNAARDNLQYAINGTGTPGTHYYTGMTTHATVYAQEEITYGNNNTGYLDIYSRIPHRSEDADNALSETSSSVLEACHYGHMTRGQAGDSITIEGVTYYFIDTITAYSNRCANLVEIGASATDAIDNLVAAITLGSGAGSVYSFVTTEHPTVTAARNGSVLELTAKSTGTGGNALTVYVSEGFGNITVGTDTMTDGADGTVTIDSKVYTFQAELTNVDGNVHIGGTAEASLDNLIDAINLGDGAGVDYAAAMTLHSTVAASAGDGDTMDATAKSAGTGGNSIATTAEDPSASWGASTLEGGVTGDTVTLDAKTYTMQAALTNVNGNVKVGASAEDSLDNLIAAINLGAGSGSTYAAAMTEHPTVSALAGDGDVIDLTAKTPGTGGDSIATTETSANASFGGSTLSGGQTGDTVTIGSKTYTFKDTLTDVDGYVKIGASASDTIDNLVAAVTLGAGAGTVYADSMTANADATAAAEFGDSLRATALVAGPDGDSIATTETGNNISWRDATLVNGTNSGRATGDLTLASNFIGEVAATGTLTAGANVSGGAAATKTLTFSSNISEYETAATAMTLNSIMWGGYPYDGAYITIDGTTYTFRNTPAVANDVRRDVGTIRDNFGHLAHAFNGTGTPGYDYYTGTTTHPTVTATFENSGTDNFRLRFTAKTKGSAFNSQKITFAGMNWGTIDFTSGNRSDASFDSGRDNPTVTIDGKVYTFQFTLTNVNGHVKRESTVAATISNLIAAINLGSGSGTAYAAATTLHPTVSAAAGTGDSIDIAAKTPGPGGNSIEVDTTSNDAYWTDWALSGGDVGVKATGIVEFNGNAIAGTMARNAVVINGGNPSDGQTVTLGGKTYTARVSLASYQGVDGAVLRGADASAFLDNLAKAISLTGTPGTHYSSATTIHPTLCAGQHAYATIFAYLLLYVKNPGTAGNGISSSHSMSYAHIRPTSSTEKGAEGDSVTIDGITYKFVYYISTGTTTNDTVPYLVEVGSSATDTIDNLVAAITKGAGGGSTYSSATTAHPTVTATRSGSTLVIEALATGTGGNSIGFDVARGFDNLTMADTLENGGDGDTVTLDSKTYTFQDTLTDVNGNVKTGADAEESLDNLIAAVMLGSGSGTLYAASMTLHSTISAVAGDGDTMDVTAKTVGTVGNTLDTTETGDNLSFANATLTGGLNGETITVDTKTYTMTNTLGSADGRVIIGATAEDSINNLVAAICLLPGAGSLYTNATTLHSSCLAVKQSASVMRVSAKAGGTGGDSIASTETAPNASFGGSTLSGGNAEETATIDSKVYTFMSSLVASNGNVKIGATMAETLANFAAAIILGPGTGTAYANEMTVHSSVSAAIGVGNTMTVAALAAGTAGNSIATTEDFANGSWGASTLEGGDTGGYAIGNLTMAANLAAEYKAAGILTMASNVSGGDKAVGELSAANNIVGGVAATGTLTAAANMAGGDAASHTLTLTANLETETAASALLMIEYDYSVSNHPLVGSTVTIDGVTYTFKDTLTQIYDVQRNSGAMYPALSALTHAINGTGTPGTDYYTGTPVHTSVTVAYQYVNGEDHRLRFTAKTKGSAFNGTQASTSLYMYFINNAGVTEEFGGGTDNSSVTIDGKTYTFQTTLTNVDGNVRWSGSASGNIANLIAAINLGSGAGTDYATDMTLHPTVSAAAGTGDAMDITAKTLGVGGNSIDVSVASDNAYWTSHTLSGGDVGIKATGAVAFDSNVLIGEQARITLAMRNAPPSDGQTVTIDGKTYTFWTSLSGHQADGDVLIGADSSARANNLMRAIHATAAYSGTSFGSATTVHSTMCATVSGYSTNVLLFLHAKKPGTSGNGKSNSESASWIEFRPSSGTTELGVDGDSVTIDGVTYLFVKSTHTLDSGSSTNYSEPYLVRAGASTTASIDNLVSAITDAGGSNYTATSTSAHSTVTATRSGTTLNIEALSTGAGGNSIAISVHRRAGNITIADTMSGGGDGDTVTIDTKTYTFQDELTNVDGNVHVGASAEATLDNLIDAINLGSGSGTDYAAATTLHSTCSAVAGDGDTMVASAKTAGTGGNSIATTETGDDLSWGAATLEGGVSGGQVTIGSKTYTFKDTLTDVDGFVKAGASATESLGNLIAAITLGAGAGTKYATSMTEHPDVTAAVGAGAVASGNLTFTDLPIGELAAAGVLTAAANVAGSVASSGVLTAAANVAGEAKASGTFTVSNNTTLGGVKADIELWCDYVRSEIDLRLDDVTYRVINFLDVAEDIKGNGTPGELLTNIMHCINGTGTPGVHYHAASTSPHPTCEASAVQGSYPNQYIEISAKVAGTAANSYVTTCSDIGSQLLRYQYGLTLSGGVDPVTATIDSKTYTFQNTLTNVNGNVKVGAAAADSIDNFIAAVNLDSGAGTKYASAMTLHPTVSGADGGSSNQMLAEAKTAGTGGNSIASTETGSASSWSGSTLSGGAVGDTVTVDTKTYTFQENLTNVDGNVLKGASAEDSLDNLIAAITAGAGSGSTYAAATTEHTTCTASAGDGDTMDVAAKTAGPAGDSIATTETGDDLSFAAGTLGGGVTGDTVTLDSKTYTFQEVLTNVNGNVLKGASASDSLDNLIAAINLGAGNGTLYATLMSLHTTVSALAGDGDTVDMTAKTAGTSGNSIATTETGANLSFAASTLEDGTDGETVYIAGNTYRWRSTLTDVFGYVKIEASVSGCIDNIVAALNAEAGSGTKYAASTTIHTTIAGSKSGSDLVATARTAGVAGNALVTTEVMANASWGAGTLAGGEDSMDAEAKSGGTAGNSIATTETSSNLSWGGANLSGGTIGDQVTLDAKTYTFQDVLTDTNGNVLIGASASDSIDNLIAAITTGAGSGTLYAASTTLHSTVTATAGALDTMDAEAKSAGTAGNSIATTETSANMSFADTTLLGGLADSGQVTIGAKTYNFQDSLTDVNGNVKVGATASDTLDNLIAAIMLGSGSGSLYAASMTLHPTVTAAVRDGDVIRATAKTAGSAGSTIGTTTTLAAAVASWGNATLVGGVDTSNFIILSVAAGEIHLATSAVDSSTADGLLVAHNSNFGVHSLATVAGQSVLQPKNLCAVRDGTTGQRILSSDKVVYGLLQCESLTDEHTIDDVANRVMLSLVRENATADGLEAVPTADVDGLTINYTYPERTNFLDIGEDAFLHDVYEESVPNFTADVTLDAAIDAQSGAVTQDDDIDLDIADGYDWAFRDAAAADLLRVHSDATGANSIFEVGAAVDYYDNDAQDVDFDAGVAIGSNNTAITINEEAGHISRAGDLILSAKGGGELYLDDVNHPAGWSETDGVKLSESEAEWTAFEAEFGEVSLLAAISTSAAKAGRVVGISTLVENVAIDTDVDATTTVRLNQDLPSYTSVGTFVDDVDVYVNGGLLINGADSEADCEVYPGSTPAQGMLKFKFELIGTGGTPDVIRLVTWGS